MAIAAVGALFLAPLTLKAKLTTLGIAVAGSILWQLFSKSVSPARSDPDPQSAFAEMLKLVKANSCAREVDIPNGWKESNELLLGRTLLKDSPVVYGKSRGKELIFVKARYSESETYRVEVVFLASDPSGNVYLQVESLSPGDKILDPDDRLHRNQKMLNNLSALLRGEIVQGKFLL